MATAVPKPFSAHLVPAHTPEASVDDITGGMQALGLGWTARTALSEPLAAALPTATANLAAAVAALSSSPIPTATDRTSLTTYDVALKAAALQDLVLQPIATRFDKLIQRLQQNQGSGLPVAADVKDTMLDILQDKLHVSQTISELLQLQNEALNMLLQSLSS
jgi:hypothetical protein